MHISQINDAGQFIHKHQRQISIKTQRSRFLQSNGLNPLASLSVKYIQMSLRVNQQMAIAVIYKENISLKLIIKRSEF